MKCEGCEGGAGEEHVAEHVVGADLGVSPYQGVQEFAHRKPPELEGENPDHHQGKGGGEHGEQGGAGDGCGVFQDTAPPPGNGLTQKEPGVEGSRRGGEEQHRRPGQPLHQNLHDRAGEVAEGNAEVAGKGVLHVDEVLLPKGSVQAKGLSNLLPNIGRQVGIEGVEGSIVARLGLHQEEGQRYYQKKGEAYLPRAAYQVACHRGQLLISTLNIPVAFGQTSWLSYEGAGPPIPYLPEPAPLPAPKWR